MLGSSTQLQLGRSTRLRRCAKCACVRACVRACLILHKVGVKCIFDREPERRAITLFEIMSLSDDDEEPPLAVALGTDTLTPCRSCTAFSAFSINYVSSAQDLATFQHQQRYLKVRAQTMKVSNLYLSP